MRDDMIDEALDHLERYEWDANVWMYLYFMLTRDEDRAHVYEMKWYDWWSDLSCE